MKKILLLILAGALAVTVSVCSVTAMENKKTKKKILIKRVRYRTEIKFSER